MKEATGELNMTVVTLIAIAAIGAVFYFVVWPIVQGALVTQTCRSAYGADYTAQKNGDANADTTGTSQAKVSKWKCCDKNNVHCYDSETGLLMNGGSGH